MSEQPSAADQARRIYEEAEAGMSRAAEELVSRDSFGELLGRVTENAMAVTRLGFDALDMVVRNLRIAGRPDLIRLGRQLGRNEDKLEMVLQEVERVGEQVRVLERKLDERATPAARRSGASRSSGSRRSRSAQAANGGSGQSRSQSK